MNPNLKSAEDWLKSWDRANVDEIDVKLHINILKQIQLNAYKAGMTEAADITALSSNNLTHDEIAGLIEIARDRKESL